MLSSLIKAICIVSLGSACCYADLRSNNGTIRFDTQVDQHFEMILNSTGLGIGTLPSSNLHVNGNSIITEQLFIGGSEGSSNLNINGSIGFSIQTVSTSTTVGGNSMIFADTSSDNLTLTLPFAGNVTGRKLTIKKISSLNSIWISGGGNIENQASYILNAGQTGSLPYVEMISDGSQWLVTNSSLHSNFGPILSANLILWLDADDTSTLNLDSSGNLLAWYDKSGQNSHATSSVNRYPSGNTAAINGRDGIYFNGSEDMTLSNMAHTRSNYTIFAIYKTKHSGTSERFFASNDGSDRLILWSTISATTTGIFTDTEGNVSLSPRTSGASIITWSLGSPNLAQSYINGVSSGTATYSQRALEAAPTLGSEGFAFITGDIGELIFYDKLLSDTERIQVETYLSRKWGISL